MKKLLTLLMTTVALSATAQDSCMVFGDTPPLPKLMGFIDPVSWKNINYVVHIHHSDSFPTSYISTDVVLDADEHLNEQFEEAFLTFDLASIQYHDLDDFWMTPILATDPNTCVPSGPGVFYLMQEYLEPIQWDNESYMNVHLFPEFCGSLLGFAWLSYYDNPWDGVWVRSDMFGRFGEHLTDPARMDNKTLIHEVGHFVGLHHVFKGVDYCGQDLGDCLTSGDYVCDTPPTKLNWSCTNPICPPGWNSNQPWADYVHDNHMDYYVDSCRQHFTEGQIERIHEGLPIFRPNIIDTEDDEFCLGDLNGDLYIGTMDLLLCLDNFGDAYWLEGDLNGDGFFTIIDLTMVLAQYGTACYGAELDPFYREEETPALKGEGLRKVMKLLHQAGVTLPR